MIDSPKYESIEVGPGSLKMSFSSATGQLERMFDSKTGVSCLDFLEVAKPVVFLHLEIVP